MNTSVVSIRLPDELLERIDAAAGDRGRSGWFKEAAEARLGGGVEELPVSAPVRRPKGRMEGAAANLHAYLMKYGRVDDARAQKEMGWNIHIYRTAKQTLVSSGRALAFEGMVEAL